MKWRVLALIWSLQLVNYLDRVNIAVAGPRMMRDLRITPDRFGLVLAAFTLGYALMQIPGGWLADRFGAWLMLAASPLAWSAFTALTGLVRTAPALIAVRVLFGAGEGASNGASFKIVGDWFPPAERARANGLYLTAVALGPACVAPLAAWLVARVGWQSMFLWFSLPGLAIAAAIGWLMPGERRDAPAAAHAGAIVLAKPSDAAARMAQTEAAPYPPGFAAPPGPPPGPGGLRAVISRRCSWLLFVGYMAFNLAFWGYLGWMPSYLALERHVELARLGVYAAIPYLFGFLGLLVFGALGSGRLLRHRAPLVAVGYLLAAVALYATFRAATAEGSVAGLSAAAFFLYGGFGPIWAIVLDLTPAANRGAFSGFVNCGGQIGGFVAPVAIGYLVALTHGFTGGFLFMMAGLVLSAACFAALHPALTRPAGSGEPPQPRRVADAGVG